MSFSLRFIEKENWGVEVSPNHGLVRITIGSFYEHFETSLEFWSIRDYQNQWKEALQRIVDGKEKSCLLTSINNPKVANFYIWWSLYREKDRVYIHNNLFFLDQINKPFDLRDPYKYVQDRETTSEDGHPISEWEVAIEDIVVFLSELSK